MSLECEVLHVHEDKVKAVKEHMVDEEKIYDLADLFKVFGDSTRIKILVSLIDGELCVCDIASLLNMTHSAISHQLATLKMTNLVKSRKEGKTVYYSLADEHISSIIAIGKEHVMEK